MKAFALSAALALLSAPLSAWAEGSVAGELEALLQKGKSAQALDERIELFSRALMGRAYSLNSSGEGPGAKYDQNPLYRFDTFDCTTFIESVMALTLSHSGDEFIKTLKRIRYKNAEVSFTSRNHFPDLDWMPNNLATGLIEDVTERYAAGVKPKSLEAEIDKASWYRNLSASRIHHEGANESELLTALRAEGAQFKPQKARVLFVPFRSLFTKTGYSYAAAEAFFAGIPSGTFFNIVIRRAPKKTVGTALLIWHQGILIRKGSELYIRHASNLSRRVVEVPAFDFLLYEYLSHRWDGAVESGINLFRLTRRPALR